MTTVRDWSTVPVETLALLFERERRRWRHTLHWDVSSAWAEVETARTSWGLPGLVALDDGGHLAGATFYVIDGGILQVGGLFADTAHATCALLDGLVSAAETAGATMLSVFVFEGAPSLSLELSRRGFEIEPFLYLTRALPGDADHGSDEAVYPADATVQSWNMHDVPGTAALLREAYGPGAGRHFAPTHTPAEWERYVRNLVQHTACGVLHPGASQVLRSAQGRIVGVVLVTTIAPEVAHVAQVAVHPLLRRQGVADRLLARACAVVTGQGYRQVTLLVGASNRAARDLYGTMGFVSGAAFVAGSGQPRRLTRDALATGGASTRR
ncbi:MAG: GNAT family N-acetyltransferase [Vicinamibacterales bacterium]